MGQPAENPPVHRRFPRKYRAPEPGSFKLQTSTTNWYQAPDVPFRTPTHVLAVSQEPFPKHNPWKYSNHGMRDIYPPYERNAKQLVDNQFNKYGAAFATASEWNDCSTILGVFKIYFYKHKYTIISVIIPLKHLLWYFFFSEMVKPTVNIQDMIFFSVLSK